MTALPLREWKLTQSARHRVSEFAAKAIAAVLPPRLMRSKRHFDVWQRRGYHVIPVHFYEPVPDTRELPSNIWEAPSETIGLDFRSNDQLVLLSRLVELQTEYDNLASAAESNDGFFLNNGLFEAVDAEIFYSLIRIHRPRRIIEVGSGFSTLVALRALAQNAAEDHPGEITAFDPFPPTHLRDSRHGALTLRKFPIQDVDGHEFEALEPGDIFFVDSTHVLSIGSDVHCELLEIVPRLREGTFVHFHDIFLPYEYPRDWVLDEKRFWNEQYALQAFLAFNDSFRVIWSSQLMHRRHSPALQAAFSSYDPLRHSPGSFWMRRVK
jgi:hypothetical protein